MLAIPCACQYKSSKNYKFTTDISSYKPNNCKCKLYVEAYYGLQGISDYLTDSVSFRFYTGAYDDESQMINYHCKGDSIFITKKQNTGVKYYNLEGKLSTEYKVIDKKVFSLKQLRAKRNI